MLDADFHRRYLAAVAAIRTELNVAVRVVSGFRSYAEQRYLYEGWLARKPGFNLAAPPGHSNHERGLAIDIAPNSTPAMRRIFARYGLHFPIGGEPWHVEPMSARGLPMPAFPSPPPPPPAPPTKVDPMSIYHHFKLHPDAANPGEPVDWVVAGGDKAPCGSTGFLADIARDPSTYRFHDLSGDVDASRWFRQGHP